MEQHNMGNVIDQIRLERQLSREDLCDDIMSVRNYQRFITGEVNVSNNKLQLLIDRLNLDFFTVSEIYRHRADDLYSKLQNVYQLMQSNSDKAAYELLQKISIKNNSSTYLELFYTYLLFDLERQLQIVPLEQSIERLSELISYPQILEYKVLNFIELNVLVILNTYYAKKEDHTIADFLYQYLLDDNLNKKGILSSFLPALYSSTAQSLGTFMEYDKSLEIATKGLDQCRKLQMYSSMHNLLFFKAISEQKLGLEKESKDTVKRLYALLDALDEPDKTKEYNPILERIFKGNNK
jgi:transcriptional regulator with XRE-family HTH domain